MSRNTRLRPLQPVFDTEKLTGSVQIGNTPSSPIPDPPAWAFDDFNRADGPLGADWTDTTGAWEVNGNRAYLPDAGSNTGAVASWGTQLPEADFYAQITIKPGTLLPINGYMCGLVVRQQAEGAPQAIHAVMRRISNVNQWAVLVTSSAIATASGGEITTDTVLRIECEDTALRLYVNDVLTINTSSAAFTTNRWVGIVANRDATTYFDDFKAGPL